MKSRSFLSSLVLVVFSLSISAPSFAQTKPKSQPTSKTAAKNTTPAPLKPAVTSGVIDFSKLRSQAETDLAEYRSSLQKNQLATDSDAVCRVKLDMARIKYAQWFLNHSPALEQMIRDRKVQMQLPHDEMLRNVSKLNEFQVSVLVSKEQAQGIRDGLIQLKFTDDQSQVWLTLNQTIQFLDLFNARMKSCSVDPNSKTELVRANRKAFEDPFANPFGLTLSQVESSFALLTDVLNAKLKSNGITYSLNYIRPGNEDCTASLELVQTVTEDKKSSQYRYKLVVDPKTNSVELASEHKNSEVSDLSAFKNLVAQKQKIEADTSSLSLQTQERLEKTLKDTIPYECKNQIDVDRYQVELESLPYSSIRVRAQEETVASVATKTDLKIKAKSKPRSHAKYDLISKFESQFYIKDNKVYAWGKNNKGKLGIGTVSSSPEKPTEIIALRNRGVVSIDVGESHAVALLNDGTMLAWGYNYYGQLGHNDSVDRLYPTEVPLNTKERVVSVHAAENSSFALLESGEVMAWGYGYYGTLGLGESSSLSPVKVPTRISGLNKVKKLVTTATSDGAVFALREDGSVFAWGYNANGELGFSDRSHRKTPTEITMLRQAKVVDLISDGQTTYALLEEGDTYVWGRNNYGIAGLGHNNTIYTPSAMTVLGDKTLKSIQSSTTHTVALLDDEESVFIWGSDYYGAITGQNRDIAQYTPILKKINAHSSVVKVCATTGYSLALLSDGSVYAWGGTNLQQLRSQTQSQNNIEPFQLVFE